MERVQKPETLQEKIFSCSSPEQKRELLKSLSKKAKELIETEQTDATSVNEVLIGWYTNKEHKDFKTFKQWKDEGQIVIKGQKAFFVWSKPVKASNNKKDEKDDKKEDEKERSFFRMAYLFSNSQVEPIKGDK